MRLSSLCYAVALATFVSLAAITPKASAQGEGEVETNFLAMLENATLKGTWAPVSQGRPAERVEHIIISVYFPAEVAACRGGLPGLRRASRLFVAVGDSPPWAARKLARW